MTESPGGSRRRLCGWRDEGGGRLGGGEGRRWGSTEVGREAEAGAGCARGGTCPDSGVHGHPERVGAKGRTRGTRVQAAILRQTELKGKSRVKPGEGPADQSQNNPREAAP